MITLSRVYENERGQVVVMAGLLMLLMLGIVALSVDIGRIYLLRQQLVTAADAAALAGTFRLPDDPEGAMAAALEFVQKNGFGQENVEYIKTGTFGEQAINDRIAELGLRPDYCMAVKLSSEVKSIFGAALLIYGHRVKAVALAYQPIMAHGWVFDAGGHLHASPVISNGRLYVGTAGLSSYAGNMFAIDAETGQKIWMFNTVYGRWGRYVNDGIDDDDDGKVDDYEDDDWEVDETTYADFGYEGDDRHYIEHIQSTATVVKGVVYFASANGFAYACDAKTGIPIWRYYIGIGMDPGIWINSSPVVYNGVYYIGSVDGYIYALNADNGRLIDSYKTGDRIISSPNVVNNVLYIGSNDHKMRAFDLRSNGSLSLKWERDTGGKIRSRPYLFDGKVYFGSGRTRVYALDAQTGDISWSYNTGHSPNLDFIGGAIVERKEEGGRWKNIIHIGDGAGFALALEENQARNGVGLKWERHLDYRIESTPAIKYGVIYYGTRVGASSSAGGNFYALDTDNGEILQRFHMANDTHSSILATDYFVYYGGCDSLVHAERINTPENILAYLVK